MKQLRIQLAVRSLFGCMYVFDLSIISHVFEQFLPV